MHAASADEQARVAAALRRPAPRGADGAALFMAQMALLPRSKDLVVSADGGEAVVAFRLPPPPLPAHMAAGVTREIRQVLAQEARGARRRRGASAASSSLTSVTVRHFHSDDVAARSGGPDDLDGGPRVPADVLMYLLTRDKCVRLPAAVARQASCTDADTGELLPPEEGVTYL